MTSNQILKQWVEEVSELTRPDNIHWCTGSQEENQQLVDGMLASGVLIELNQETHPGCYLHRSDPDDVARVEHVTFICTPERDDAGPNNHWMEPAEARTKMHDLYAGCMQGRTLYVIPYCMGPIDSPLSRCGVEITDSPYVVANMRMMTRMGSAALARIEREGTFVKGLHSIGELDPAIDAEVMSLAWHLFNRGFDRPADRNGEQSRGSGGALSSLFSRRQGDDS